MLRYVKFSWDQMKRKYERKLKKLNDFISILNLIKFVLTILLKKKIKSKIKVYHLSKVPELEYTKIDFIC